MSKITYHLWFDKEAKEAAEFYTSLFADGKIINKTEIQDTPSGTIQIYDIQIGGEEFTLLNAGPDFKFNPSISFFIACDTIEEVESMWNKMAEEGKALMDLGEYEFSKKYGWIQDKYGLSWQIMFMDGNKYTQKIIPTLMYSGNVVGRAEEAMNFYTSVFHNSKVEGIWRYKADQAPDKEGTVMHGYFSLDGKYFAAMDSARQHDAPFNEAISLMIHCKDQKEIDYYWEKLSAIPESEQCGWLKDKFGVSWQIVPHNMNDFFKQNDPEKLAKVTQVMLQMKKLDIAELERAAQ